MANKGYLVSGDLLKRLKRLLENNVDTTGRNRSIGRSFNSAKVGGFWAKITGHTTDGTNRWLYTFVSVIKNGYGYGTWVEESDPFAGDARNTLEDMNSNSGVQGTGVDLVNLPDGFEIKPVPTNAIIRMYQVYVTESSSSSSSSGTSNPEYWFSYENAVDGDCGDLE